MVTLQDHERLDGARRRASLSLEGLWVRYFELSGVASMVELEGFLTGALVPTRQERDVIAHAINEALQEAGSSEKVPYLFDE